MDLSITPFKIFWDICYNCTTKLTYDWHKYTKRYQYKGGNRGYPLITLSMPICIFMMLKYISFSMAKVFCLFGFHCIQNLLNLHTVFMSVRVQQLLGSFAQLKFYVWQKNMLYITVHNSYLHLWSTGQLFGFPWKLWGIRVQTSYWKARLHQNWVCSRPTKKLCVRTCKFVKNWNFLLFGLHLENEKRYRDGSNRWNDAHI